MENNSENLVALGKRILLTQRESGMSQKQFCELAGISLSILRKYIDGISNPSYSSLMLIHKAGKVNLHWLMTGEGDPQKGAQEKDISAAQRVQIRELARRATLMIEQEEEKQNKHLDAEVKAMMMSELIIQGLLDGSHEVSSENVIDLVKSAKVG